MSTTLSLDNAVRVSLIDAQKGLQDINTSVIALISSEEPISASYGDYGIYIDASSVINDFGSSSKAAQIAEKIFSQSPNILTGSGYLVIIPRNQSADATAAKIFGSSTINLSDLSKTDYTLTVTVDGGTEATLSIGEIDTTSIETVLSSLNNTAVTDAGLVFSITGDLPVAQVTLATSATGATKSIEIGTPSTGTDIAALMYLSGTATGSAAGVESVKDAIVRTVDSVPYFGIITDSKIGDTIQEELSSYVQTLNKLLFIFSETFSDVSGIFKTIKDSSYTHTRCLYYSASESDALNFAAAYASFGLSVDFSASNTATTMHLKSLTGIDADSVTQTQLNTIKNNGVDCYVDFGVGKTFTSGENSYFDLIYMKLSLKLKIQTAVFNLLATTNTKIAQTESGMSQVKSVIRKILNTFVYNGYVAPGAWNSSTTYGNPEDHIRNIEENGYYIYSSSIASQSQTTREQRVAPTIQIAVKTAGAIHSANITIYVEQ